MAGGGHGVNFIALATGNSAETLATGAIVAGVIATCGLLAGRRILASSSSGKYLVPEKKLTLVSFMELLAVFIRNLGDSVMGKENRRYLPLVGTVFLFIFTCNVLGLVPGFSTPTDSFAFNLGIGLTAFLMYNFWGARSSGTWHYFLHFFGPPSLRKGPLLLVGCVLFVVEVFSHSIRPITLSLRLFANMTGDHAVLATFTDITKFIIPVVFYFFGLFVCFMQAFIFTMLTMVYIRLAVVHDSEH